MALQRRGKVTGWFLLGRDGLRPVEAAGFEAGDVWAALNRKHVLWQYEGWFIHLASEP